MSYKNHSKIEESHEQGHNMSFNSQQLELQARALQEQIDMTIYNYEALLDIEKKNSAERSQFLLFMIQSTRMRQQEELEALKIQLETAVVEKDEAQSLQKQMETIGDGVDSIVEEGKRLKQQNEALVRELEQQQTREKEIDEEIESSQRELEGYRQKVDEWQRTKIKWNRRKKELLELISSTEKQVHAGRLESMQEEEEEEDQLNDLYNKYRAARKK